MKDKLKEKYKYITYLVGAMQHTAEKDDGSEKREVVEKELLLRNVFPINPVKLEVSKTGLDVESIKEKMKGWIASGNWQIFKEKSKEIWYGIDNISEGNLTHVPGDIEYTIMSDWITFTLHKKDKPCGSFFETGIALEHRIPVYVITDFTKTELGQEWGSLLQAIEASDGEIFPNLKQYFEFIDKKYGLKRQEDKKEDSKEEKKEEKK